MKMKTEASKREGLFGPSRASGLSDRFRLRLMVDGLLRPIFGGSRRSVCLALIASVALSLPASGAEAAPVVRDRAPTTYCNPISLPDYPIGRLVRDLPENAPPGEQYRELADPSALWYEGKWYLYPSCDMAWVSSDEGLTWVHHPLNVRDIGYAPTVVKHDGRFLLVASDAELYSSSSPLGPFEKVGKMQLPKVPGMPWFWDPMLFSDHGRLFLYWGCTPRDGIWAVELDAKNPLVTISKPFCAIPFRPDLQPWEALGDWNQDATVGWLEGAWMLKVKNRYYLTYSAAGTEYRTYAMGCYVSDSPLGPFKPQKRNPILRTTEGLITGTGHGCIVAGPRGRLWAFYCVHASVLNGFERRIGFDLAAIDANGELYVPQATSLPQYLPAPVGAPERPLSPGWLPLNQGEPAAVSSAAGHLTGRFAVDNNLMTWWQPAKGDASPVLTTAFRAPTTVRAVRLIWRDIGLDTRRGANPGPFRYRVEVETAPKTWQVVLDRSKSQEDLLIDYRECAPVKGSSARLVIVGAPKGITPGVAEFTVFGDKCIGTQ